MKTQPPKKAAFTSIEMPKIEGVRLNLPEIGERLRLARKALGMTQEALAALAGSKSKRGLQENEKGNAMPGGHIVGALAQAGINTNWIFTGAGPMLMPDLPSTMSSLEYPAHQSVSYAVHESVVDTLLLEKVSAGLLAYLAEHKDSIRIDANRHAALIAVLYKYAVQAGGYNEADLRQLLRAMT